MPTKREYTETELREMLERNRAKQREKSKRHYERHKDSERTIKLEYYHSNKKRDIQDNKQD